MSYELNNNDHIKTKHHHHHHHHKKNRSKSKNKKNKKNLNNNSYNEDKLFDNGEKLYNFEDIDIEDRINTKRENSEDNLDDLISKNDDFGIKLNLSNNHNKNKKNNGIKIVSDKDSVVTNYNKNLSEKENSSFNDFKPKKIPENQNENKNDNKIIKNDDDNFLNSLNNLNVFKDFNSNNSNHINNDNKKLFIVGKEEDLNENPKNNLQKNLFDIFNKDDKKFINNSHNIHFDPFNFNKSNNNNIKNNLLQSEIKKHGNIYIEKESNSNNNNENNNINENNENNNNENNDNNNNKNNNENNNNINNNENNNNENNNNNNNNNHKKLNSDSENKLADLLVDKTSNISYINENNLNNIKKSRNLHKNNLNLFSSSEDDLEKETFLTATKRLKKSNTPRNLKNFQTIRTDNIQVPLILPTNSNTINTNILAKSYIKPIKKKRKFFLKQISSKKDNLNDYFLSADDKAEMEYNKIKPKILSIINSEDSDINKLNIENEEMLFLLGKLNEIVSILAENTKIKINKNNVKINFINFDANNEKIFNQYENELKILKTKIDKLDDIERSTKIKKDIFEIQENISFYQNEIKNLRNLQKKNEFLLSNSDKNIINNNNKIKNFESDLEIIQNTNENVLKTIEKNKQIENNNQVKIKELNEFKSKLDNIAKDMYKITEYKNINNLKKITTLKSPKKILCSKTIKFSPTQFQSIKSNTKTN